MSECSVIDKMKATKRAAWWRARPAPLVLMLCAALAVMGTALYAQQTARAKEVGKKLMCVCGCGQVLVYCNHVGCAYSSGELKELDAHVAHGDSEDAILSAFVGEYGLTVLSEPPASGFNWFAWIMPVLVPLLALVLIWQLVRRWRRRAALASAGAPQIPAEFLARAHHESARDDDA
ncbi:MAG: cytochrome c-type biogenesis protein CcmH [Candidatus Acidiferrales bacterium]